MVNGEYYHIYNRGVASQPTYFLKKDYQRFLNTLQYYRFNNLSLRLSHFLNGSEEERNKLMKKFLHIDNKSVDIIAFCLMPNHFHLLLKQITDNGISKFMKKVGDSYTRYFNTRHVRVGPLFQGAFKVTHISNDEQLIHISRYIHLNPLVSYVIKEQELLTYPWSSLTYYLSGDISFVNSKEVLVFFKSPDIYLKFILDQADYGKRLESIKHLIIEK